MKATEYFKNVIQNYLEERVQYDEFFAENYRKIEKDTLRPIRIEYI